MATSKRTPSKPRKKGKNNRSRRRSSGGWGEVASRARERLVWALRREVVGGVLLVGGLFFSAAFFSGRGAFLGEAGLLGATHLMGRVGVWLAPLAATGGALLLLGRLSGARALGVVLLLLAAATTFAATLPRSVLFSSDSYTAAGGVVGSVIYGGVHWTAGSVGATLALIALYILGLSLLTGVSPAAAVSDIRGAVSALAVRWRERRSERQSERLAQERRALEEEPREELREEPPLAVGESLEETREFEVVVPESPEPAVERELVLGEYTLPSPALLGLGRGTPGHDAEETSRRLTRALSDLGVEAQVLRAVVGPRVTRYELRLGSGVKVGKVRNLQQDIAYALAATEVRILAPIPGKSAVGVEVPNTRAATVTLGDVFREYPEGNDWALPVGLGKDISGRAVFFDLAEMPHLLVAGTTGSGKSVMLNGLLTSLLLTTDPRQVKMVLIDPKRVELSYFGRIPHLITPVVTDVKKAANALSWAVAEMERRYEVLEKVGARSLEGYNGRSETTMPYVVVVIDELADLMMQAAAKVEDAVIRIAQKARAVGIHLVIATQRPSVDVITGMIKANVPSRIAFAVSSQVDSRVILDTVGAESLLGMGDMLFKPVSAMRPSRVQGAFISEGEVERVVDATVEAGRGAGGRIEPSYVPEVTEPRDAKEDDEEPEDELLPDAASFVVATQQASVSAVQRRFRVGYSRAGRIVDALERKGVVGPHEGSKSRSVLVTEMELGTIFGGAESPAEGEVFGPDNGAFDGGDGSKGAGGYA
ncbi:MAG TPA: DNA translocase FtsK 4TM domain-containing protein [Rubrobacteraceae bacterium]|nr:DNA translocase FtsK 4TM domain-containing protein [Rubrobacteraceae bacterium]